MCIDRNTFVRLERLRKKIAAFDEERSLPADERIRRSIRETQEDIRRSREEFEKAFGLMRRP
jgi:hypothetical protein